MYIDNKNDPQFQKLIKMTREEFDKYMCETYPTIFRERNLPMSETCMCWGFDINRGWYYILDNACRKLSEIAKYTQINTIFTQIKEKYGTARFYHEVDTSKASTFVDNYPFSEEEQNIWRDIIDNVVSDAENATEHTCSECGEYHSEEKPKIGHWVYDTCIKCLLKAKPEYKERLENNIKLNDLAEDFKYLIHELTPEELANVQKTITDACDRIENNSNKN